MSNISADTSRAIRQRRPSPRVLVLLPDPSALREPAICNEIAALEIDYEVGVLIVNGGAALADPADEARGRDRMLADITAFRPDVLHAHGFHALGQVAGLAEASGLPFTVRTHARDLAPLRPRGMGRRMMQALRRRPEQPRSSGFVEARHAIASEHCLGILALPFTRPWFVRAGLGEAKLIECFPAANIEAVHDRGPNGDAVMSLAPAPPPTRSVPDILRLAARVPERTFTCYAAPEAAARLAERNAAASRGITILPPPDPAALPRAYKQHRWLVLTADTDAGIADWPLAIAEAQAAGVGVCMPALRPDLARYVGNGAGILYETVDELPAIVSAPVPEEMRERGFAQAQKSDIARHRHLLTDLWDSALRRRAPAPRTFNDSTSMAAPIVVPGNTGDMTSAA